MEREPAAGGRAVTTARPRLLYVEDDAEIAEMTLEVLSETYDVVHESDGVSGRDRALRERFDVMLLDWRLPGLEGAQIVRDVRTAHITTPVLMLTARGAVADRVDGLDAGANDYLLKPFDFDELLARLRTLRRGLPGRGSTAAAVMRPACPRVSQTAPRIRRTELTHRERRAERGRSATALPRCVDTTGVVSLA